MRVSNGFRHYTRSLVCHFDDDFVLSGLKCSPFLYAVRFFFAVVVAFLRHSTIAGGDEQLVADSTAVRCTTYFTSDCEYFAFGLALSLRHGIEIMRFSFCVQCRHILI